MTYPILAYEHQEDPKLDWITMAVRMKLDLVGLKLRLKDWQTLPIERRRELQDAPAETESDIDQFGKLLNTTLRGAGHEAPESLSESRKADISYWKDPSAMPRQVREVANTIDIQIDWARLDRFGRYVLWTLAKKDATERFAAAAAELTS